MNTIGSLYKPYVKDKKCLFGRQHSWQSALSAALNANEGADLPESPKWVYWCHQCGMVGPWEVEH